ncbi:hypothetical protein KP509_32G032100 [Ceratopteris richardii]|uniref:U6 snRNA phosphodiesterase n=1 Tax=Ceratopteris richardii TaxID=49495 RepID=A0A8T2QU57_CERRI|nr:hypothetical protein KP509_32G032100 [Ceratopteris richardii]KAH7286995.1 hypothetical protein KP509_32G032100 [Ceratopteris richardii]
MDSLQCYASDSDSSEQEIYLERSQKKAKLTDVCDRDMPFAAACGTSDEFTHSKYTDEDSCRLPPPPMELLTTSNSISILQSESHFGRIRSFPHVEGNYALHVYIPVPLSALSKWQLEPLIKKAYSIAPELKSMEMDEQSQELKLSKEYHISLSRTVAVRLHQINSIVTMLQNKFERQKGFWFELNRWELFINDEKTRSFLSLEVVGKGLVEICRQIQLVDEVFQLHNLPVYYKTPRPHASVAWALGDRVPSLERAVEELRKVTEVDRHVSLCGQLLKRLECKVGSRTYCIWKEKVQHSVPY